jgi:hypothetical protein
MGRDAHKPQAGSEIELRLAQGDLAELGLGPCGA